jgi:Uma2 family endonuclease
MNWQHLCNNPALQNLPYKMELNQQGQIIMSPASVNHVIFQAKIIALLNQHIAGWLVVPEFPIETKDGVKVMDVGIITLAQAASLKNHITSTFAPIVCIEVLSPSNTLAEMQHKRDLYFDKGAEEFWLCDQLGNMSFYDPSGAISASKQFANFPANIDF